MNRQISQNRAFIATENFRQEPIKMTVAHPNYLAYAFDFILRLIGVK
jgi:hypothetical protein